LRSRKKNKERQRFIQELIGARVADANSTIARSGCPRYKYLSRERAREGAGTSASRREGWSTSRRTREIMACTRVSAYAWIRTRSGSSSVEESSLRYLKDKNILANNGPHVFTFQKSFVGKFMSDFTLPFSQFFVKTFIGTGNA